MQALRLLLVLSVLTGVAYPVVTTVLAEAFFPHEAGGSLVQKDGHVVGTALLAQKFENPRYFWPRPSAADYATVSSGASNKGPTSADLQKTIATRREAQGAAAPADLLTTSASGLDPHLSPAGAEWQIARVAAARGLSRERVTALVQAAVEAPQWNILGEPRVNVLALNLALDAIR